MITLNFTQTIELLKRIDYDHHIPMLIGPPGLAKSACAKKFCEIKGIPFERQAYLSIALNDTGDIVGFPVAVGDPNSSEGASMTFATPVWWLGQYDPVTHQKRPAEFIRQPFDDGLEYCLIIDEANRDADPQKQAAMINLFLERNIQGRYLPKRTYVILSVNEGEEYLTEDFDPAVKNRIMRILFKPTIQEWLDHFKTSREYNSVIENWIENDSGRRHFYPNQNDLGNPQFCSPRSLTKLAALLINFECGDDFGVAKIVYENKDLWNVLKAGIYGIIGDASGKDFITYLDSIAEKNKSKVNISVPVKFVKIFRLSEMPPAKQMKEIQAYSPIEINDLMYHFMDYLESEYFKGWDSQNKSVGQSIINGANVPTENKLQFIHKCKSISPTNAFDLYESKLLKEN
jgi:hypothetical protein